MYLGDNMIETVVTNKLSVDETLVIRKNRLEPVNMTGNEKRICIITGTHGDELEGQYVCYEIIRRIKRNMPCLAGIVDVYPALNPLGIDAVSRGIPMFDLDMNRIFPGGETGAMAEHVAAKIITDLSGADMCIDIHSSDIFLREIPQVRIAPEYCAKLMPYAKLLNTDFIWIGNSTAVRVSSLSHALNSIDTPTLVIEMGVGMRISQDFCNQIIDGIFKLMSELGIWTGETVAVSNPIVSTDGEVALVHAEKSGVFIPAIRHWIDIRSGDHIGDIVNPLSGEVEEEIISKVSGMVFTLREYPVVSYGCLLARILGGAL